VSTLHFSYMWIHQMYTALNTHSLIKDYEFIKSK